MGSVCEPKKHYIAIIPKHETIFAQIFFGVTYTMNSDVYLATGTAHKICAMRSTQKFRSALKPLATVARVSATSSAADPLLPSHESWLPGLAAHSMVWPSLN